MSTTQPIPTKLTVYRVGNPPETITASLAPDPGYDALKRLLTPLLDGADLEHVTVLHEGKRADMFVDDEGVRKGLPINPAATAIYRNNWLTQHPGARAEELPPICGPAVLFDRRVWF